MRKWLKALGFLALLSILVTMPVGCGCARDSIEDWTYFEPGSLIPRLTEEGKVKVKEIALKDSRVRELIAGKNYAVARKYDEYPPETRIGIWHTSEELMVLGAALEIWFDKPYTIQYDWFMPEYNEDYEYCGETTMPQELQVHSLHILVDFRERKVVGIQPLTFGVVTIDAVRELEGIWGSSSSDVFAVGRDGVILHYDGTTWTSMNSGTTKWLKDIWGSSSSDAFAVGVLGTILHYDGASWSKMDSGTTYMLRSVWGTTSSDVFVVGWNGLILHYDGSTWSSMTQTTECILDGVWGSSSSNVFAVGVATEDGSAIILHYDGTSWTRMETDATAGLRGIWGTSASDIFAGGDRGTILHYDGTSWNSMASGTQDNLGDIWGSSASDVYAVAFAGNTIHHYDGTSWTSMETSITNSLRGVWGSSSSDVFCVGSWGTILHYNGNTWSQM